MSWFNFSYNPITYFYCSITIFPQRTNIFQQLEQHTYSNCPVCSFPLNEDNAICPRCGNDILEDIASLDQQSREKHLDTIEQKKAEWYARCITESLDCCEMKPSTLTDEDFVSHRDRSGSSKLVDKPVFSETASQLISDPLLLKDWWDALNTDWRDVVKSTLKISKEPSPRELQKFFTTTHIRCDNRRIHSLAPVRVLEQLQQLRCDESPVENLEPLKGLRKLQRLYAFDCDFVSLEPLREITSLKLLWISSTQVSDLEPVSGLVNLEELYCSETPVYDLFPLTKLENLEKISFYKTSVSSLAPLRQLQNLIELGFNHTGVSDLTPLEDLENLEYLRFSNTTIDSLAPLAGHINIRELSFNDTLISSLDPLSTLPELEEVSFAGTPVSSIEPLMELGYLEKIELSAGQVPAEELEKFLEMHPDCEVLMRK